MSKQNVQQKRHDAPLPQGRGAGAPPKLETLTQQKRVAVAGTFRCRDSVQQEL